MSRYQHNTWNGKLEWQPDPFKTIQTSCQIFGISKIGEHDLKMDTWEHKLIIHFRRMALMKSVFSKYSENYKTVFVLPQPESSFKSLAKGMKRGHIGLITTNNPSPDQSGHKVLLLLYAGEDRAFLGLIPNNHAAFLRLHQEMLREASPPASFHQIYKQPESLFELASHIMGNFIAKSASEVYKKCSAPFRSVYAQESKKYPDLLVVSAAEFLDTLIPHHLHDIVTRQSLACISSLDYRVVFGMLENDYNILDMFIRSYVTNIDFTTKTHTPNLL